MPIIGFFVLIALILKFIVEVVLPAIAIVAALFGIYAMVRYLWERIANRGVRKVEKEDKVKNSQKEIDTIKQECREYKDRIAHKQLGWAFMKSYVDNSQHRIDILDWQLQILTHSHTSELSKKELKKKIKEAQKEIESYHLEDDTDIPESVALRYQQLCKLIDTAVETSSIFVSPYNKDTNRVSAFDMEGKDKVLITRNTYCGVTTKMTKYPYRLSFKKKDIYIYPLFVILVDDHDNPTLISWAKLKINQGQTYVYEGKEYTDFKNGTIVFHTYEHSRVDGEPDLRYKYNTRYDTYLFGNLSLEAQEIRFILFFSNKDVSVQLFKAVSEMIQTAKNLPATIEERERQRKLAVLKGQPILYTKKEDISDAVYAILCEFGIEILEEKRFTNIINDRLNFSNNLPIKRIIRDLSISGDLKELAEARYSTNQSTQVISNKVCHHLVSVYGYQENLINEVLTGIAAAIDKYLQ